LTGAADAEVSIAPGSLPVVFPYPSAQVLFHHVHDTRGNLVPDGAVFGVSVASCATRFDNGQCVTSAGGSMTDGTQAQTTGFKLYTLSSTQFVATYSPNTLTFVTEQTGTAVIQLASMTSAGALASTTEIQTATLPLTGPGSAVGTATPASVL